MYNFPTAEVREVFINIIKAMTYDGNDPYNWARINTFFVLRDPKQWNDEALMMSTDNVDTSEFYTRLGGNKVTSGYLAWQSMEVTTDCDLNELCRDVYLSLFYDQACKTISSCKKVITQSTLQEVAIKKLLAIIREAWRYGRYVLGDGTVIWGVPELVEACYPDGNYTLSCNTLKDVLTVEENSEIYETNKGKRDGTCVTIKLKLCNCDPSKDELDLNYSCEECSLTKGLVICPC